MPRPTDLSKTSGTSPSQQGYYSLLIPRLSAPFRDLPWQHSGFPRFVRQTLDGHEAAQELETWNWTVLPDAWYHDPDDRQVTLLEIVETNDVSESKARRLANLFWLLDIAGYYTSVVLFYPQTSSTLVVNDLPSLDAVAEELKGRRTPYRDAFESLKQAVAA